MQLGYSKSTTTDDEDKDVGVLSWHAYDCDVADNVEGDACKAYKAEYIVVNEQSHACWK